ncbi:Probable polygalacturonase At3g15720 [Linum grandiflorum]
MTSSSSDDRHETLGYGRAGVFNVLDYGAVGDGRSDSSAAFAKAWDDFCGARGNPTLVIPAGKVFLLNPVSFQGPCNSQKLRIQLQGTLLAPWSMNAFANDKSTWIQFAYVNGLTVNGGGKIDGQGQIWWDHCQALKFHSCNNLVLNSLHHVNSQRNHISISGSNGVDISHIMITAPETSPNTDGIDIATSSNGGRGYVRRVSFQDITLVNAENPIIIDQEYFSENARPSRDYVAISDIRYSGVRGTCSSEEAVDFNCVGGSGCKGIVVENLDIRAAIDNKKKRVIAVCNNVHGWSRGDMSPKMSYCLRP